MRGLTTAIMAAVILGLVALGIMLDRVAPPEPLTGAGSTDAVTAIAGAWVCAAGETGEGSTLEVVAAAPSRDGGEPATLAATLFADGDVVARTPGQVFPDSAIPIAVEPGLAGVGAIVRWWDVPTVISREWRAELEGAPSGIVAGPCQSGSSERWIVPGLATAGGAQARLVLANPFDAAASVAVELTTPDGPVAPKRLENVVVPERSTIEIPLNEHAPEQPDLGAIVTTRSGRVVAEAVQTFDAAIGGIEGRSLVAAAAEGAETWTIPSIATGPDSASWIWITNPSDREAALLLSLHTPAGGFVPEGLEEVTIPAGSTRRVELVGLLDEKVKHAGASVISDNGVPVVVSTATQFSHDTEDRTGITVSLAAAELDPTWVMSPGGLAERTVLVDLVNPTGEETSAGISLWTGSGLVRPDELVEVRIPAGGSRRVDVTPFLGGTAGPVAIFVAAAEGELAAGVRTSSPEGRRDPVAFVGVPGGVFRTGAGAPSVRFAPTLPQRIGTASGPERASDPLLGELGDGDDDPDLPEAPTVSPPS